MIMRIYPLRLTRYEEFQKIRLVVITGTNKLWEKQGNYNCHNKDRTKGLTSNAMHYRSWSILLHSSTDPCFCPICGSLNYSIFLITFYLFALLFCITQNICSALNVLCLRTNSCTYCCLFGEEMNLLVTLKGFFFF